MISTAPSITSTIALLLVAVALAGLLSIERKRSTNSSKGCDRLTICDQPLTQIGKSIHSL